MESEEFQVEGVKCTYERCDHCGAVPTRKDLLGFIRRHESTCDFCEEAIKVVAAQLSFHRKDQYGESWAGPWETERYVILKPEGHGRREKRVHETCYKKMFPIGEAFREMKR